jgi:hypothetical protein
MRLGGWSLFERDFVDCRSVHNNMRLEGHGVQKYPDAIAVFHVAFKYTAEVLEATVLDHHFIAGLELLKIFHKTIVSHPAPNQLNDFIINRNRLVVETYNAVNASGEAELVVELIEVKTRKDVAGEKRFD